VRVFEQNLDQPVKIQKPAISQSLLVTDSTLKSDYASVIFVDPAFEVDES